MIRFALFYGAFTALVFCVCPIGSSGDSRWTVPVAWNILTAGDTGLARYGAAVEKAPAYTWERVAGTTYATYPVAVSAISAPIVGAIFVCARLVNAAWHPMPASPARRALLSGDALAAAPLVEMLTASVLMGIATGVQFLIFCEFVELAAASLMTVVFAFATPVWSTASRALWNHTPALLMLTVAMYLLILARRKDSAAQFAGIPLSLAFMARPTMAVAVAVLGIYVFVHHRRNFLPFCLWTIPIWIAFFGYNLTTRHQLFQSYFVHPGDWPAASLAERFGLQLISPSRGLFVFSPVLLFAMAGAAIALRKRWLFPLTPYLAVLLVLHTALVTKYFWPGYCYGPRYFTETMPALCLFLVPAMTNTIAGGVAGRFAFPALFALALGVSAFVHARGATTIAVHEWNSTPVSVNVRPGRAWDWSDPQFLRGLHR